MGGDRKAAQRAVGAYHEAELAGLVGRVAEAIESQRRGELDVFAVDDVIHRYGKAARELWKFCWQGGTGIHLETVARIIQQLTSEGEGVDWWAKSDSSGRRRRT